ncbi:Uncharacterised protein [Klebsiella pneumoniae]|nr:Uncharacterised protein [Klebsiella pneumoniae]
MRFKCDVSNRSVYTLALKFIAIVFVITAFSVLGIWVFD